VAQVLVLELVEDGQAQVQGQLAARAQRVALEGSPQLVHWVQRQAGDLPPGEVGQVVGQQRQGQLERQPGGLPELELCWGWLEPGEEHARAQVVDGRVDVGLGHDVEGEVRF